MRSEDIKNRRWTRDERQAVRNIALRQAGEDDSAIDFSDAPRLTAAELRRMVSFHAPRRKVPVSVRLDPRVLKWLRSKGTGHLTRINDILTNLMEAEARLER